MNLTCSLVLTSSKVHVFPKRRVSAPHRKIFGSTFVPLKISICHFTCKVDELDYFLGPSMSLYPKFNFTEFYAIFKTFFPSNWHKIQKNKHFGKRLRYDLENSLVNQPLMWNENGRILRAPKLGQGIFWEVLARCSKGRDEAHMPHTANVWSPL